MLARVSSCDGQNEATRFLLAVGAAGMYPAPVQGGAAGGYRDGAGDQNPQEKMVPVVIQRGNLVHYHMLWGMALSFSKLLEPPGSS